jgi:hypothetical protein
MDRDHRVLIALWSRDEFEGEPEGESSTPGMPVAHHSVERNSESSPSTSASCDRKMW